MRHEPEVASGDHGIMMQRLGEKLHVIRTPMYANANALLANQILSAGIGFVYWVIAARLYDEATVGASNAVISTLLLISGVAQLGFGGGMTRFLPRAGKQTRRLILVSYAAVVATSVVLSLGFVAFGGALGLRGVLGEGPLVAVWAVAAAVLWSIFRLQDQVLIGLRQAKWVLIENTLYNVMKLVLLVVGVHLMGRAGLVGSWFLPTPLVIVLCTWLVFGVYTRSRRIGPAPQGAVPLTVREVATSSGGDHVGSLVAEAASRLLPLLIIAVLGDVATAYFTTAWLVATTLGLLAGSMTDSFTAEAAGDRANIGHYSRHIMRYMAVIIVPAAAILGIGAPIILTMFGKGYASEGATLLRWLCLSGPLIVFNTWYIAYARVVGRIPQVIWIQSVSSALLLGLSYVLLQPLGIAGVGVAWLLSQAVIALIGVLSSRDILFPDRPARGGEPA
jgi:O-antigen/teichoic acid export membrane protein